MPRKYADSEVTPVCRTLRALSDPNRMRIVEHIARQDGLCALDILEELSISQPTLSLHMKALVGCGLVKCLKDGRWRRYEIDREALDEFLGDLRASLAR